MVSTPLKHKTLLICLRTSAIYNLAWTRLRYCHNCKHLTSWSSPWRFLGVVNLGLYSSRFVPLYHWNSLFTFWPHSASWKLICHFWLQYLLTFSEWPPPVELCYNIFIQMSMCLVSNSVSVVGLLLPLLKYNELIHSTCWRIVWPSCCSLTLVYRNFRLLTHEAALCHGSQTKNVPTATISGGMRMRSPTKLNFPLPDCFVQCVVQPGSGDYCAKKKKF